MNKITIIKFFNSLVGLTAFIIGWAVLSAIYIIQSPLKAYTEMLSNYFRINKEAGV